MNGWIWLSGAAFKAAQAFERVADRCAGGVWPSGPRRPYQGGATELAERTARELAELAQGGAMLLATKGAIVAGEAGPFWAAFEQLTRGHVPGGCQVRSPTRCECLLMGGHEGRGFDIHVDRHGRAWTEEPAR